MSRTYQHHAMAGHSCLYDCRVLHERFAPRRHRFVYPLFYFSVDLDELPRLAQTLRLFSTGRGRPFSLRERDYLPLETGPGSHAYQTVRAAAPRSTLKERVRLFCARHGVALSSGARVQLVTLPRVFGFQFNPVSFYFCHEADGTLAAAIAEVTNTFREVKPYFVPARAGAEDARRRTAKHFYVSPFSRVTDDFDFRLRCPDERLAIRIDNHRGGERTLHSTLTGRRRPITDARLAYYLCKYPVLGAQVLARIHWQAARLWWKRTPYFRKSADAAEQRDLHRPGRSLPASP